MLPRSATYASRDRELRGMIRKGWCSSILTFILDSAVLLRSSVVSGLRGDSGLEKVRAMSGWSCWKLPMYARISSMNLHNTVICGWLMRK